MIARDRITEFLSEQGELAWDSRESYVRVGPLLQTQTLLDYLDLILQDYERASADFMEYAEYRSRFRDLTDEERRRFAGSTAEEFQTPLHLRIETFYLFAKILLDKVGLAIQHYFGPAREASLSSHSKLRRNLLEFARQRDLSPPPLSLLERMDDVETRIIAYRDYQVTHDQSPRTAKATSFVLPSREAFVSVERAFPDPEEQGVRSENPQDLRLIDEYLLDAVEYIRANRDRASPETPARP
jgi:hypothetical protein